MNPQTIGYILYYARNRRKISQDELAGFLGCSQGTITSIENARTQYYSENQLINVCQALHLDTSFIEDKDLVSFMPKDFQRGESFLDCSIITARFASLSEDNAMLVRGRLVKKDIIKATDCPGIYFDSATIHTIIGSVFKDGMSFLFGRPRDYRGLFGGPRVNRQGGFGRMRNIDASVLEKEVPYRLVDTDNDNSNKTAYRTRFGNLGFAYINSIINHKLSDPFTQICSELSINIKDDIELIEDFINLVGYVKLAKQGEVRSAIKSFVSDFLNHGSVYARANFLNRLSI